MKNQSIPRMLRIVRRSLALAILFIAVSHTAWATGGVGIYVDGQYYAPTVASQNIARSSGYTSLFLFTTNIDTSGTITGFGATLCQNGAYTGDPTWRYKLAACKAAPSSVNRIEIVIGNWGTQSFANIQSLIASQGTGTNSILYQNFLALKNATGVDAIQFDDETTYDVNSMVAFGNMLASMGLKVTLCPYTNQAFWVNVKSQLGSKVDAIYLQCYDGGAGNDPANWISAFGGFKVTPGLWGNTETLPSATAKMVNWKTNLGIPGGFMWLNGTMQWDYQRWPPAFNMAFANPAVYYVGSFGDNGTALQGTGNPYISTSTGQAVAGCNEIAVTPSNNNAQQRWSISPIGGGLWHVQNTSSGQLLQATGDPYLNNAGQVVASCDKVALTPSAWNNAQQSWTIPVTGNPGFSFASPSNSQYLQSTNDSFLGISGCYQVAGTPTSWGAGTADQWNLIFNSNTGNPIPNGTYQIVARTTGTALDCTGGGAGNGTPIEVWTNLYNPYQQWRITSLNNGYYSIINPNSGRSLDCTGFSGNDGTQIELWDYNGNGGQQWKFTPQADGGYSISPALNNASGVNDVLDGDGCSGNPGARIILWPWGGGSCQQEWNIVPM